MKIHFLKLALISIILLTATPVFAEENEKSIRFGLQSGINISFFNTPITEYADNYFGFEPFVRFSALFGVKSKYQFSTKFALITELNISSKGGSYRAENTSVVDIGSSNSKTYYLQNFRLTYLEIPFLIDLNLTQLFSSAENNFSLIPKHQYISFSAGLSPSLNISSSIRYNDFTEGNPISGPFVEIKSHWKTRKFDYAKALIFNSIIEFAYNIALNDTSIASINLRWTQSLNDVYKVNFEDYYNMQTKMSTITLGASILF